MKANPNETTVKQTVRIGNLQPLPPVTIRRCAVEVELDQVHDDEPATVSIEFDSLQKVIDNFTNMLHDHDLEDRNRIVSD